MTNGDELNRLPVTASTTIDATMSTRGTTEVIISMIPVRIAAA
jgi:hypothetical protein